MKEKAIYLKVNRKESWALDNLHRWLKISVSLGYDTYIICDDKELEGAIKNIEFGENTTIIKSMINKTSQGIVKRICIPRWENAAYAHLTSFMHAKMNEYRWFWNIDADDTYFCLPIPRVIELLRKAEECACHNEIRCFSLDMWYSRLEAKDWSFGITYTDGMIDWENLIIKYSEEYVTDDICHGNIDNYFFYLRQNKAANIETFYVENLSFIHYSVDFFKKLIQAGLYRWKDGMLLSPIALSFDGLEKVGKYKIPDDTIKIDIQITDEEAARTILYYSNDGHARNRYHYISWEGMESREVIELRQRRFNKKMTGKEEIEYVLFGSGVFFNTHVKVIGNYNAIRYVADNDDQKWCSNICGLKCISPEELRSLHDILVVITVLDDKTRRSIEAQLDMLEVNHVYFKEWERAVFADNEFI